MKIVKRVLIVLCIGFLCACSGGVVSALAAEDTTGWRLILDTTYLQEAVVSAQPITLSADLRDSKNVRIYGKTIRYSVTAPNGIAEIKDGNKLYIRQAGDFTVRAEYAEDSTVYIEFSSTAYRLTFSDVELKNDFSDITVYTPPIRLQSSIRVDGIELPSQAHYLCVYSVVSGNAALYCDEFLKITGVGAVEIQVASRYDATVSKTVAFTVTDPDEGRVAESLENALQSTGGKGGCASAPAALAVCAVVPLLGLLMLKKP